MELRTLRYFLTICQEGTMSRAAEVLHITQPALSRQIAALERELGTQLLERHSRSVIPTEKGLYLRRRAEEIVGLANQTEADFAQPDEIVAGTVHIGAGESEGFRVIAQAVRAFRERYPNVRFCLHSSNAIDLIERLEHGVDDFAVLMNYQNIDIERLEHGVDDFAVLMNYQNIDRYDSVRLRPTDAWGVLMRDDDPLAAQETVGPADLGDAPLIVPERLWLNNAPSNVLTTWLGDHASTVNVAATFNLSYNAALFVREGIGRMITFEGITPAGPGTGLEFRLMYPPAVSPIDVAWKRGVALSHAAQLFLKELQSGAGAKAEPARQALASEAM